MQPDYSRQVILKDVGAAGQAKLARSRVLIVGIGGLGNPVLQYLTGAGVGFLGLVDADTLHASNLHRQPIYAWDRVGEMKVHLAESAVAKLNPSVRVETHAARLTADNAVDLIRAHDIVVDCSDNFRTKFLINDAAVLAQRPAVFASVYQYEGQLQVYKPQQRHACLRCLWPGAFGALQALMTLKILLNMPGQLDGELLLVDFMNFSSVKIQAPRRAECIAPRCALIHELPPEDAAIEMRFASLDAAAERRLELIDIRSAEEFAAAPTQARHIPVSTLLANPGLLTAGVEYLFICASGKRSLAAARALRRSGLSVHSLSGGLQAIEPGAGAQSAATG